MIKQIIYTQLTKDTCIIFFIMSNKSVNHIICPVYGQIPISAHAQYIITHSKFQRLQYIKQTGLAYLIFKDSIHTRYDHSIGVYYLTRLTLQHIKRLYPDRKYDLPELCSGLSSDTKFELNERIMTIIEIAALCHDIGHGPYSHLFDFVLLSDKSHPNFRHEVRSCLIVEIICKDWLSQRELNFLKSIIDPKPHNIGPLYQIVCNNFNGIDVDKLDYIYRDSHHMHRFRTFNPFTIIQSMRIFNNNIVYSLESLSDIQNIFTSRFDLHKNYYNNSQVKCVEQMWIDHVLEINNQIDSISDIEKFCLLVDNDFYFDGIFLKKDYFVVSDTIVRSNSSDAIFAKMKDFVSLMSNEIISNQLRSVDFPIDSNRLFEIVFLEYGYSNTLKNPLKNVLLHKICTENGKSVEQQFDLEDIFKLPFTEKRFILILKSPKHKYDTLMKLNRHNMSKSNL